MIKASHQAAVGAAIALSSALALPSGVAWAAAPELSGAMTVDNEFSLYLSTTDSALGTLLLQGSDWGAT